MSKRKGRARELRQVRGLALASPRWWPTWLGLGVLWLLAQTPWRLQVALGRAIGRILYHCTPERRRVAHVNIELCFREWSAEQRRILLRRNYELLGVSLFEMASAWWGPARRLRRLGVVRGGEHVEAALAHGHGVILMQAHFLSTEICGQILAMHFPVTGTYAPPKNPVMRTLTEHLRARFARNQIHHEQVREVVRELQGNHLLQHGPDQSPSRRSSIEARFFGRPALSSTSTAKLARISGARVVPYRPLRLPDGRYEVQFDAPLEDFPGDDIAAATQRVNDVLEAHIRAAPEQYLWAHKRFKRQARDAPDPYA